MVSPKFWLRMPRLLFVLLPIFPFYLFSRPVRYEVAPLFRGDELRLQVCMWFAGDADGETHLLLPGQFGPADKLFRCIRNLGSGSAGCRLKVAADTLSATLQHAPGQEIKLCYEVVQDFAGANPGEKDVFRPILQAGYFHVLGQVLFLAPRWPGGYEVTLTWKNFPADWVLYNSFGAQATTQHFSASGLRWLESVFVGGDYRAYRTAVQDRPVWLVVRGRDWGFRDDSLLTMLERTVASQRNFWQDFDLPEYTVVLTPLAMRPAMSSGAGVSSVSLFNAGAGLTNSFTAFATPHPGSGTADLCHLFHHEMMHDWIGGRIRSGTGPEDMQLAWFSEGFTEYLALKNMLSGGFITAAQYIDLLNGRVLDGLYRTDRREAPNRTIADSFFVDSDIARLPYLRGCAFAFFMDNAIKAGSSGRRHLHGLMLDLLEYYQRPGRSLNDNFDFFLETCSGHLERDMAPLYEKYIVQGRLIPVEAFTLPPYLKMEAGEAGVPVLHLDRSVERWESSLKQ